MAAPRVRTQCARPATLMYRGYTKATCTSINHGLGRLFHDEPNIVHIGRAGEGAVLKPGMFFTIEPMINLRRPHVKLSDG